MAIMVVFSGPTMTREQYDALRPIVQWESNAPEGLLLHACGFDQQGGLHVTDVWESGEQAQGFFQSRLMPAFQELGINAPPPTICEAHNIDAYPGIEKHTP
jgi:hypothetical protein